MNCIKYSVNIAQMLCIIKK